MYEKWGANLDKNEQELEEKKTVDEEKETEEG